MPVLLPPRSAPECRSFPCCHWIMRWGCVFGDLLGHSLTGCTRKTLVRVPTPSPLAGPAPSRLSLAGRGWQQSCADGHNPPCWSHVAGRVGPPGTASCAEGGLSYAIQLLCHMALRPRRGGTFTTTVGERCISGGWRAEGSNAWTSKVSLQHSWGCSERAVNMEPFSTLYFVFIGLT